MSEQGNAGAAAPPMEESLSPEVLAERVHAGLGPRKRREISIELVRDVLSKLNLAGPRRRQAARLRIARLRFTGEKYLTGTGPEPINYDQSFEAGVNVVLVRDNDVGKSSILKTIKYALTGDDTDYDADVKPWIHQIWLHLYVDQAPFTVHLSKRGAGPVGYIASGHTDQPADAVYEMPETLEEMSGSNEIMDTLHRFFFKRFGLSELSWTQATGAGSEVRTTSWRTFFQALLIPDSSDQYLLLDEKHSYGNQEGLLLSTFLGLSLVEPMNALLIETQMIKKENKISDHERTQAAAEIAELEVQLNAARDDLQQLDEAQRSRVAAYGSGPSGQQLLELRSRMAVKATEIDELARRRDDLNTKVQRMRSRARALRQAVDFRRHFTGLEVSLCPNCDSGVADEAVEREREEHLCRLCGKPAHEASPEESEALLAEADELITRAERDARTRDHLNDTFKIARDELELLDRAAAEIHDALQRGFDYLLPTPEERKRRSDLEQRIGALNERIARASAVVHRHDDTGKGAGLRVHVQEQVRARLRDEANRMNQAVLTHLSLLTEETATRIGTESITDLTCSPLGKVTLRKNGVAVSFGSIRNPGERLRVKLAFFLAMMRLGRIKHAGLHPGFLMVDQPGSAEMVDEDLVELARILRETDRDYEDELQIICFTARPPLAEATAPGKVYGPQAGKYAF